MLEKTTRASKHVPLVDLFGIVIDKSIEKAQNMLATSYMTQEWGFPENQVVLTGDGHWWITLDYRKENKPRVSWIDIECKEKKHIADSFDDFINELIPEDKIEYR